MIGLILSTLLVTLAGTVTTTHYHIVPASSTDLCQHYPVGTCFTLEEFTFSEDNVISTNITLSFLPGDHHLTRDMRLDGITEVTLNRELHNLSNRTSRITCLKKTGFTFTHIKSLTVQGLEFFRCERDWFGIITVYSTEHALIKECWFTDNKVTVGYSGYYSGGGAISILKYSTAVIQNSTFYNNSVSCSNCYGGAIHFSDSIASIHSCSFKLNSAVFFENRSTLDGAKAGGGALAALNGTLMITSTTFHSNIADYGGSVYASFGSSINISSCLLVNNTAIQDGGAVYAKSSSLESLGNVYLVNSAKFGGAILSTNTTASINGDSFSSNMAPNGAAIYHSDQQVISICDSIFTGNLNTHQSNDVVIIETSTANFDGEVLLLHNHGSLFTYNSEVNFYGKTTFFNNTGSIGGAITSDLSVITFETSSRTIININVAKYGGGMALSQTTMYAYGSIVISNNRAEISGGGIHAFKSVIEFRPVSRVFLQDTSFIQHTIIANNVANINGGGVYLAASNIKISNSYVHICGNTAKQYGGGAFLEQSSRIDINKWVEESSDTQKYYSDINNSTFFVRLEFTKNSALRGGAVYVLDSTNAGMLCKVTSSNSESQRFLSSKECFLQTLVLYNTGNDSTPANTVNTFFKNNIAKETGSDIYGGLLDRCTIHSTAEIVSTSFSLSTVTADVINNFLYSNGLKYINATVSFDWANGKILHVPDFYDHISSDPVRVCFCENDTIVCNSAHPTVFTKKGRKFTLNVVVVDQVGRPLSAKLISSLTSSNGDIGRLKAGQQVRKVKSGCTELEYNVYSNDSNAEIELYADGPCGNQGSSKQIVNISFLPCNCPIGLERYPLSTDCFCDCDRRIKQYISNCSSANSTIQLNTNVWIEYVNVNTTNVTGFVTPRCPLDYCVEKPVNVSLGSRSETDHQCSFNRTGRICGQCEEGLSLVFASSRCQECSNYYLFLLLPFTGAGIALVAFIMFLNMTVATGTIHGLIFYANMLAANHSIFLPFDTPNFLSVFISWLNLDLGIETCFYDGMDSYGKLLLQLVFPTYVFVIIVAIIVLCDRSQRLAVFIGRRNPEATLYTLILLSYSKLVRIIITALQFTTIDYPDGTQKIVWFYDANVVYFSVSHIPRFLTAFIIIILGTVYTTLLLLAQLFDRCSEHKLMRWATHNYYTHFIRAHQAPLSDKHRYWVGLLLFARLTHYLISAFTTDSIVILSAGTMAFVLVLHKLLNKQTYNSWSIDLLETSFFVNLAVLALSTFYVRDASGNQQVLAFVSMSICFITFLGIVFHHVVEKFGIKLNMLPQRALEAYRRRRLYQPAPNEEENQDELFNEDEHFVEIDEVQNYTDNNTNESYNPAVYHTPPIIRHAVRDDQLREPALDDLIPIQPEDYDIPPAPRPRHREMVTFAEIDIHADQEEND